MEPLFWLLLPVAAASGWFSAKAIGYIQSPSPSRSNSKINQQCIKGLNYVLSDQSDKAIEMFVGLVDVDEDTVETHIVLGSLFRGRGEVNRAIRVHQNIIARPSIPRDLKQRALLQLGIDYLKAGLLDRAENIFGQLSDAKIKDPLLYESQCRMFEQEREWESATQAAQMLEKYGKKDQRKRIAHYICEQVENLVPAHFDRALKLTRKAVQMDKNCIRAYSQQGAILTSLGRHKEALKCYKVGLKNDCSFAPVMLKQVMNLFKIEGKLREFPDFLHTYSDLDSNAAARFFLFETYEDLGERAEVERILIEELSRKEASPYIVKAYLEWMRKKTDGEVSASFGALDRVLESRLSTYMACHCTQCGFESNAIFWQCPGCQKWGSVEPYQNPVEYSWLDTQ